MSRFLPSELNDRYEQAKTIEEKLEARRAIDVYYAGGEEEFNRKEKARAAFVQLQKESDRSLAITWAAILEDEIRAAIAKKLRPSPDFVPVLKKTFEAQGGALRSFSSVIDFGGLLSIYNKAVWTNLSTIKKVRNDFAHQIDLASFEDAVVAGKCKTLTLTDPFVSSDHEFAYLSMPTVLGPVSRLGYRLEDHPLGTLRARFSTTCYFIWTALHNTYADERHPCLHPE